MGVSVKELTNAMASSLADAIERSDGTWTKPYSATGPRMPHNPVTGRSYSGMNWFVLAAAANGRSIDHGGWATYRQWQKAECQVRKGEYSVRVIRVAVAKCCGEKACNEGSLCGVTPRKWVKVYPVFSATQVDGTVPVAAGYERDAPEWDHSSRHRAVRRVRSTLADPGRDRPPLRPQDRHHHGAAPRSVPQRRSVGVDTGPRARPLDGASHRASERQGGQRRSPRPRGAGSRTGSGGHLQRPRRRTRTRGAPRRLPTVVGFSSEGRRRRGGAHSGLRRRRPRRGGHRRSDHQRDTGTGSSSEGPARTGAGRHRRPRSGPCRRRATRAGSGRPVDAVTVGLPPWRGIRRRRCRPSPTCWPSPPRPSIRTWRPPPSSSAWSCVRGCWANPPAATPLRRLSTGYWN